MSKRGYDTRLQSHGALTGPFKPEECACCDKPATHWLRWAFTPFRGEDEVFGACKRHYSMGCDPKQQDRYFGHMRSKDRFLKRDQKQEVKP